MLLPAVTTLFENNVYEGHTKTKHVLLKDAHLSILAASTIDTYQQTWTSAFTDIGFGNRVFIVPGSSKRRFSIPKLIPEHELDTLKTRLIDLLNLSSDLTLMPINDEAEALFDAYYMAPGKSIHHKRLDGYGHRLMVLFALNDGKTIIDAEVVHKVLKLLEWQLAVRRAYDPIDAENVVAKMEMKIRRALSSGPKNRRKLRQATHADRDGIKIFDWSIENLTKENEIYWDIETKKYHKCRNSHRKLTTRDHRILTTLNCGRNLG